MIHQSRIDLWFSKDFNPIENDPTSNPLRIFDELDRASKEGGHNLKTASVEGRLLAWVELMYAQSEIDELLKIQATLAIELAHASGHYSPIVLYLHAIDSAEKKGEPDEFVASSQSLHDRAHVRQILPPVEYPPARRVPVAR